MKILNSKNEEFSHLTQWDVNRKLKIEEYKVEQAPMFHFYNEKSERALVVPSKLDLQGNILVDIPNKLTQQPYDLIVAMFITTEKEGQTEEIFEISMERKAKPEDYNYEENIEYFNWVELSEKAKKQIAEMQGIIDDVQNKLDTGAFKGDKGDKGDQGIQGIQGVKGDKGDKGDTYTLTEQDREEIGDLVSNNAESKFNKYYDGKVLDFNTNSTNKTDSFNNNALEKTNAFNENSNTKTSEFNINASNKTSDFNANSETKVTEYDNNASDKLKSYNDNDLAKIEAYNSNANAKLNAYNKNDEEKLANYNSNDETKLKAYNDNHTTKLNEYNTNAKSKTDEFNNNASSFDQRISDNFDEINRLTAEASDNSQNIGLIKQEQVLQNKAIQKNVDDVIESNKNIASNSKRLKTLETNIFDSGVASGENINIKDSALAEFQEIKSSINKAQETTKGVNLIDTDYITTIPLNKVTIDLIIPNTLKKDKSYSIIFDSVERTGEGENISYFGILLIYTDNTNKFITMYSNRYDDFIPDKDIRTVRLYSSSNAGTSNNTEAKYYGFRIMLSENKDKPWEPYTGGIASPNPDYPQEINTIKENWETVSCGKNLLPFKDGIDFTIKGLRFYTNGGNFFIFGNSKNEIDENLFKDVFPSFYLEAGTYYLKNYKSLSRYTWNIRDYETNEEIISPNKTTTLTKRTKCYFAMYSYNPDYTFDNYNIEYILSYGTEPTPYEPYQSISTPNDLKGNEFLPGDKLIKRFNEEDGKYWAYLEKNSEKTILTGDETFITDDWFTSTDGSNHFKSSYFPRYKLGGKYLSNYFNNKYGYAQQLNCGQMTFSQGALFYVMATQHKTIEEFKQWLKNKYNDGNPIEIVYPLVDEYKQLIPLAPLDQMNMTYNPETNLFSSIGNIKIEAKYYREFATTIRNMQIDNGKLQEQLNDMEKRLIALENRPAEVIEPVEESVANA